MKILLVNTSGKTGGAAIAAARLATALQNNGVYAKMLVANKEDGLNMSTTALPNQLCHKWHFLRERLGIFLRQGFTKKHLFEIDPARTGTDITRLPEFKEADIIHLHWVNQGFLSLKGIERILRSGKPVVWTMHDMWTFSGICHYVRDCENYMHQCGTCPLLAHNGANDLSHKVWKRKQRLWNSFPRLRFVACSKWLADTAAQSPLLRNHHVCDIVNPIDCQTYSPSDKTQARKLLQLPQGKLLILFCAYNVSLPIKGLRYLKEAIDLLVSQEPALKERLGVILAGKCSDNPGQDFAVETYAMGFVSDEQRKALIYNAANVFVIPSLQDNLPNTIVEAKACGVPVVGTRVGGIPQMISDGRDGRLVAPRNARELADAIRWTLLEADTASLAAQSRRNAARQYSATAVAQKYIALYESLCSK